MKAKHLILLSFLTILCTACTVEHAYTHRLRLCFQDTSGNDLLEGIDDKRWVEQRTLNAVYSETCMYPWATSERTYLKDRYYLDLFMTSSAGSDCPNPARIITLQLTCPLLFGDNDVHEIETYWIQINQVEIHGSKCYRIVIGDKEITDITYNKEDGSTATITLER